MEILNLLKIGIAFVTRSRSLGNYFTKLNQCVQKTKQLILGTAINSIVVSLIHSKLALEKTVSQGRLVP